MTGVGNWLSPDVMHALGWALIHSLWQCLGLAALAAALMVLSRRPSIRYVIAVGALALMLAAPVATFFVLMKSAASPHAFLPVRSVSFIAAGSGTAYLPPAASVNPPPVAAMPAAMDNGVIGTWENLPRTSPKLLPWLVGIWLCGVAFFSLRFAGGFLPRKTIEFKRGYIEFGIYSRNAVSEDSSRGENNSRRRSPGEAVQAERPGA